MNRRQKKKQAKRMMRKLFGEIQDVHYIMGYKRHRTLLRWNKRYWNMGWYYKNGIE